MKIAIIGSGAISGFVRRRMAELGIPVSALLIRERRHQEEGRTALDGTPQVAAINDLPDDISLLIDCAGHTGLREHGPTALACGIDVLTLSIGALADRKLASKLEEAVLKGGSRLRLASGAIGALDALRSARIGALERVTYTGRKPPVGWLGSPAENIVDLTGDLTEPIVHFSGSARNAALNYPKNANVAAAVALAGIGFDETNVELIADPHVTSNIHEIEAVGEFGHMHFSISGNNLPDNPRSSALAAMSVVSSIREGSKRIGF